MSTIRQDVSVVSRFFDGLARAMAGAQGWAKQAYAARQARAVTQHLLTHDDRLLSDIGVSRSDVERALSVPWDEDPAQALADIRRRRMQADRQGLVVRMPSRS